MKPVIDKHKKGFSLMELLIVISIIGILIAVSVVSYGSAQKKSRDSRRRSDMKAIQNALEQYYADNSSYPNVAGTCTIAATYLPGGMPVDPKTSVAYAPTCVLSGATYCSCALMENTTSGNSSSASCVYVASGTHYCVSNLQ